LPDQSPVKVVQILQ